ncbi:hypothetical protein DM02DRAFT_730836 [Periconia macrospinosa]|uniref:Uncharacterized protein n=1 Tax=Periconia macrospinosa TaxID=97972 RepID=A0A2V1DIQ9_9PLEO|nr:hypothetical protein DM02DRAFT_730836 [Periconia macrospinosa]
MSTQEHKNKNDQLNDISAKAERDLNTHSAKTGHDRSGTSRGAYGASDTTLDSGVDAAVTNKFPGSTVMYGPVIPSDVDNREIPIGDRGVNPITGHAYPPPKDLDFEVEGEGGREGNVRTRETGQGGRDGDVRSDDRR